MVINILNSKNLISKRSQSDIVATILLILLTTTAAAVIIAFVLPFVNDQISKGDCFDFTEKFEIVSSDFTCYDSANQLLVQIGVNDIDKEKINMIKSLKIIVNSDGSSKSFEIINGSSTEEVLMYNGENILIIPQNGEERTYNITGITSKPSSINVYPILNGGRECGQANNQLNEINDCY